MDSTKMGFGEESSTSTSKMIPVAGDKYRKLLKEEANDPNIVWRHGGPPVFDVVNKLFEQTRREGMSREETLRQGSYNALLKNTLPEQFRYYKTEDETFETSHDTFRSAFP
ncbi:Pathogen-related protein [Linum perenne]